MRNHKIFACLLFCLFVTIFSSKNSNAQTVDQGWTDYRGPNLNGHSAAQNIPLSWNDSSNVAWKTPMPGRGWSSPVILNNKIWLTTALNDGKNLNLLAINSTSGKPSFKQLCITFSGG